MWKGCLFYSRLKLQGSKAFIVGRERGERVGEMFPPSYFQVQFLYALAIGLQVQTSIILFLGSVLYASSIGLEL